MDINGETFNSVQFGALEQCLLMATSRLVQVTEITSASTIKAGDRLSRQRLMLG